MPDSGENPRFRLFVNGTPQRTASLESLGVVSLTLTWVRRDPAAAPEEVRSDPEFDEQDWIGNQVNVRLGGLDSTTDKHLEWFTSELRVGDEVAVQVLPPGPFDAPDEREFPPGGG